MLMFAAILLSIVPIELVHRDTVDVYEINKFYDECGKLVFTQGIFYEWSPYSARYQVVAWRMVKDGSQLPVRNFRDGGHSVVWQDGDVLREVRAGSVRESWTQYDPELAERERLPKEWRKELR